MNVENAENEHLRMKFTYTNPIHFESGMRAEGRTYAEM
jgi:hypothetical protein